MKSPNIYPHISVKAISTKATKIFQWKKKVFLTGGAGMTGYPNGKRLIPHIIHKN